MCLYFYKVYTYCCHRGLEESDLQLVKKCPEKCRPTAEDDNIIPETGFCVLCRKRIEEGHNIQIYMTPKLGQSKKWLAENPPELRMPKHPKNSLYLPVSSVMRSPPKKRTVDEVKEYVTSTPPKRIMPPPPPTPRKQPRRMTFDISSPSVNRKGHRVFEPLVHRNIWEDMKRGSKASNSDFLDRGGMIDYDDGDIFGDGFISDEDTIMMDIDEDLKASKNQKFCLGFASDKIFAPKSPRPGFLSIKDVQGADLGSPPSKGYALRTPISRYLSMTPPDRDNWQTFGTSVHDTKPANPAISNGSTIEVYPKIPRTILHQQVAASRPSEPAWPQTPIGSHNRKASLGKRLRSAKFTRTPSSSKKRGRRGL